MLLSIGDVSSITTLSRTSIRRSVSSGRFPKPVRLLERRQAWLENDIYDWLDTAVAKQKAADGSTSMTEAAQ
ncbi:helix-turn-helix transcriptional regulator [Maricaulis sp.]|uniref:helix-turn-helix transcriptional regulator n=1 Tax=Maricaulis sp. TaxID=1486257 RepID=UPI003A90C965